MHSNNSWLRRTFQCKENCSNIPYTATRGEIKLCLISSFVWFQALFDSSFQLKTKENMQRFDMFGFQIPDFPTPSFPSTTERILFKFPLLFPVVALGFVVLWKFGGIVKLSMVLSWRKKTEMRTLSWKTNSTSRMYFKSFTSNLKNLTQGLAFPNKQLDLLLAILAVPITKYQVNL